MIIEYRVIVTIYLDDFVTKSTMKLTFKAMVYPSPRKAMQARMKMNL